MVNAQKEQHELNRIIDLRKTLHDDTSAWWSSGRPHSAQRPLDPHAIAFITAVKDETQYGVCLKYLDPLEIPSGHTVERIAVFGGGSIPECYQRAMEASTARYKIYLHVDTYVVNRELVPELLHLFRTYPVLGLVGVVGSTRLPTSGIWWVNNPLYSYGRVWQNSSPGFPASLLGPANRRRLHLMRFRSFIGDYLAAVAVDGFFLATQYDIPWTRPEFGFEGPWDHVQALEFIKTGLEVGIARQETAWCVHQGPLEEPSGEQIKRRSIALGPQAAVLRQLYPAIIGVPAQKLHERYREASQDLGLFKSNFGDGVRARRTGREDAMSPTPVREGLGIIIVTTNGAVTLLGTLRALLPQCGTLQGLECQVVVVDNGPDYRVEAIRREFPQVTVIANASDTGLAGGFNSGLRHLGFPDFVLVMHGDVELTAGTLTKMVSYLREHQSTAGIIASLVDPDGTVQAQRTAIVELVPRRPRRPRPISFVGTSCSLVRGEVFFDVGLYDERFSCHEALDWSLRAKRKGYKFAYLPEARVLHRRSGRLRQDGSAAFFAERSVANLWFVYKHAGRQWAVTLYWVQRMQARWLALRWRHDSEALRRISEAMAEGTGLYRRFREENRRPELLLDDPTRVAETEVR